MKFYKIRVYEKFKNDKDYSLVMVDTFFDIGNENDIELYIATEIGAFDKPIFGPIRREIKEYFKDGIKRVSINDNEDRYFYINYFIDLNAERK